MDGRSLSPDLVTEITAPALKPFLAVHIDFPDPVFAFTGKGRIAFGGNEYVGIEGIAAIEPIGEGTDGSAVGVRCTLLRVPSEFRDDIADQAVRGCLYELYFGAFSENFQAVRGFKRIWKGTLQSYVIQDDGNNITVSAGGESRAIDQRRPSIKRFTDDYQQRRFPGDKFFQYAPKLTEIPILWAKAKQEDV